MTVLVTNSSSEFPGSGNNGPFTWTWRFLHNSHIRVSKIVNGVTILLTEGVDYAIAGASGYQGGSIITTNAVAAGQTLKVERRTAVTQDLDLRNQGDFFPDSYEEALDKQAMIIQDQQRDVEGLLTDVESLRAEIADTVTGVKQGVLILAESVALVVYDVAYLGDTTAGVVELVAPTATGKKGRHFYIENIGETGNLLTLIGLGGEVIEGSSTLDLENGMGRTIYSDGANWRIKKG